MTVTQIRYRNESNTFDTEADAYVWLIDCFLRDKGTFLVEGKGELERICRGARGAILLAPSPTGMNQPKRLANGWFAETCLNERQKQGIIYLLAQHLGISSERDYSWQAAGQPTGAMKDVDTLFKELEKL